MARSWPVVAWIWDMGRRWSRIWRGEYESKTLRSVPAWGMSLLLQRRGAEHTETIVESAIVDTALGDLTSLTDAKRSGDPFTLNDTLDPPSLGLEPADSQLKLVGQPQIASLTQFAPARKRHALGTMIWLSGTRATYMSPAKQNAHVRACGA